MFQNFTPDNEGEEKNTGHSIHVLITEAAPTVHEAKINETQDLFREDDILIILLYVALPVLALGLFSNGAIFWFLCCRIKKTKYTVYVLNLAIADFTVLFCHIIYFVIHLVTWEDTLLDSNFYLVFDILTFLGFNTSFFLLTAISVERYVGTYFPLCYRFNRPKHLSTILCVVLWGLSCIMVGLEYICWQEYISSRASHPANIFIVIVFMVFLPVMIFCSFSLFIKVSRYPQSKSPARFYRTVVITVILFLILAVPQQIVCLMQYMQPTMELNWTMIHSFFLLNLINSSLNPFVYFFVGRQKKQHSKDPLHAVIYRSCNDETLDHTSSKQVA
ncbi:proto-oncogene Mas-like [Protobothrops mucrosquamatus]|uniref:proto-oncogene Mas-like n=1 Tax=Protobothrops mucrosquamatus TaxID=103944 RepID=UPI0010FB6ECB|nr:proto-oncogene Mas-like [Protobothrops mucrosquamatus]